MKWSMAKYDIKRLVSLVFMAIVVLVIWGYVLWSVERYHDAYEEYNSIPTKVDHINTENV